MNNLDDVPLVATDSVGQEGHLAEEVQQALLQVRSDYRHAFVLFHEHEKSYGEIAEILEVPLGTVKTWVHRARRDLMALLKQRGAVEGQDYAMHRV